MHNVLDLIRNAINVIETTPLPPGEARPLNTAASGASTSVDLLLGCPVHIPDGKGGSYKTEIVVYDGPRGTIKINHWHAPDPRPEPHNHPWLTDTGLAFHSWVLRGGYTETRHRQDGRGGYVTEVLTHKAGDSLMVRHDHYHTVDAVIPGTVTLMVCGPRIEEPWGYLTKEGHVQIKDEGFYPAFLALNPHKRPRSRSQDPVTTG